MDIITPEDEPILTYQIDLSLPPSERYKLLAIDFALRMQSLVPLLDEVLSIIIPWWPVRRSVEFIASILLRRVFSAEQTEELKGISEVSAVPMYILIALNVLLDSLLGCTSGGVLATKGKKGKLSGEGAEAVGMMHFRTLDWGMDGLRSVLVVLEFVRSESEDPEKVIARTITYAGFVGVLTGVRQNLSLSLNFRPSHNGSSWALRKHQALVLFGFRSSVASILRYTILPSSPGAVIPPLNDSTMSLASQTTAPCYLILSDGLRTTILEKDLSDAQIRTSSSFVVQTNHDTNDASDENKHTHNPESKSYMLNLDAWIEESEERRDCIRKKWKNLKGRHGKKIAAGKVAEDELPAVRESTLRGWLKAFPTMNECSHFGCIMAPQTGEIRFLVRGSPQEDEDENTLLED